MSENKITVDSSAIVPNVNNNQTQIILQRHCKYDNANGGLIPESVDYQKVVVYSFLNFLKKDINKDDLKNTYFLFASSATISGGNFKRCLETIKIAMEISIDFFKENNLPLTHIINLSESSNYNNSVRESHQLNEPKIFTDSTGYLEYLKEKHGGINQNFWIDFESDFSKETREELNAEGPDQIVERGISYLNILQRYANYFHYKNPNSRLIIWNGTHYDLLSPLVKLKILNWEKTDVVKVDNCGGISFLVDEKNEIIVNINGTNYPFDFQDDKQLHRHF